ncbi:hypothetical protein ACN47E_000875 [Coniothyrium glycines]
MAKGLDALVDFLLSEIALCGIQGAESADFRRFIEKYYDEGQHNDGAQASSQQGLDISAKQLGHAFYERLWEWVTQHPDIRICHQGKTCDYTLAEFESAEQRAIAPASSAPPLDTQPRDVSNCTSSQPSSALSALRDALRHRIFEEKPSAADSSTEAHAISTTVTLRSRQPRVLTMAAKTVPPIFDEPEATNTAPRLYASQNRTWQALTGHGIDLKKVPSMEFVLLSLIAARGAEGITQPELTQLSGQDKRSVPNRTNELARKGYITKEPVQANKIRTSLCVHSKFTPQRTFLTSGAVEDVYKKDSFVLSGFVHLLYAKLKDAGIVPSRDIRKKLGVPMSTWNKRATQGALVRLDQSGMIKRFRVRKKKTEDTWITCIQVLREPQEEDVNNLGFRRQLNVTDDTNDELLDDDGDNDTLMRDLEVDMLGNDGSNNQNSESRDTAVESDRIAPQWTPDRMLANIVFDVVSLGGADGLDSSMLRNHIVGSFWRRPMESYMTRMTDDWERTQIPALRHLAVIRDSRNTEEKKFLHYVYRTYKGFLQAVEAGIANWEGVSHSADAPQEEQQAFHRQSVDPWGFSIIRTEDLLRDDGSASLSEARLAIAHPRTYGSRYDRELREDIGHKKSLKSTPTMKSSKHSTKYSLKPPKLAKPPKKVSRFFLTLEQRVALGLKESGRLPKAVEEQIIAHRQETGDLMSIPDKIVEKPFQKQLRMPLMSAEERIAHGLPPKGRLGKVAENKIREERGLPKLPDKAKKKEHKPAIKEPTLLSKEQRLALGWTGHGRLPQDLIEGLRREREQDIPIENSEVIASYMDVMKAKANKSAVSDTTGNRDSHGAPPGQLPSPQASQDEHIGPDHSPATDDHAEDPASTQTSKHQLHQNSSALPVTKRLRTRASASRIRSDDEDIAPTHPPAGSEHSGISTSMRSESNSNREAMGADSHALQDVLVKPARAAGFSQVTPSKAQHSPPGDSSHRPSSHLNVLPPARPASRPIVSSLVLIPDISSLDPDSRILVEHYVNRTSEGLYINPFARHRARGRPRKALIATFKFRCLSAFEWFGANNEKKSDESPGPDAESNKIIPQTKPDSVDSDERGAASQRLTVPVTLVPEELNSHGPNLVTAVENNERGSENRIPAELDLSQTVAATDKEIMEEDTSQPIPLHSEPTMTEESTPQETRLEEDRNQNTLFLKPSGFDAAGLNAAQIAQSFSHQQDQLLKQSALDSLPNEAVSEISPADRPSRSFPASHTTEASATNPDAFSRSQPITADQPVPTASEGRNHIVEPNDPDALVPTDSQPSELQANKTSLLKGVASAIAEEQPPAPKPRSIRSRKPATVGSALIVRRQIIKQVIDMCKGVFPDQGEIGRPFSALWDQRYGNATIPKKPLSSTVNDTIRAMCDIPSFGLKRMFFRIKTKSAPVTLRRALITYAHFTPKSPEVLRMAYNIANFSLPHSNQYFPEEIRHLVDDTSLYMPVPVAPKDESIVLNNLSPEMERKLKNARIKAHRQAKKQLDAEAKASSLQNAQVEQPSSKRQSRAAGAPHEKRARLASLNDRNKRYRRAPAQEVGDGDRDDYTAVRLDGVGTSFARSIPLVWMQPWVGPDVNGSHQHDDRDLPNEYESEEQSVSSPPATTTSTAIVVAREASATPTQADMPPIAKDLAVQQPISPTEPEKTTAPSTKKRVRIADPPSERVKKRAKLAGKSFEQTEPDSINPESDDQSSSSFSDAGADSDEDEEPQHLRRKKNKRTFRGRQRGRPGPVPTLLERLTGLTGDPDDPIYKPPQRKQFRKIVRRDRRDRSRQAKEKKERSYYEILDPTETVHKFSCALVVAMSMTGDDTTVDWSIVDSIYSSDKFFNLHTAKKTWAWMRRAMADEIMQLTTSFQSEFLEAYEKGHIAPIEDPGTHDWAGLVRWTMRRCPYPQLPLPVLREALQQFHVDESAYKHLDRARWYREKIADRSRTLLQLQNTFVAPLHENKKLSYSKDDKILKARSWTRANTATPQAMYDGQHAHDKLMSLGESLLSSVVDDSVERQNLRMRKLKRLLPGRNFSFTKTFAKKFVRPFELSDFMAAVKVKKDLDLAFARAEPNERFYSISRSEEDGAVMAILSLLKDGKVRLVPKLPAVNNEFGAPLPRLSVWGFCEGDYIHRAIDRNRLFWDIHIVPTSKYEYGNPLQPVVAPVPSEDNAAVEWIALPSPPLPGKDDEQALLPIWSSIDGQSVTWPWWYRILNMVLQPLLFQPGASPSDIYQHSPEQTLELFEIELVLEWLESNNAVVKTVGGGYMTKYGFWAAFGDRLLDTEDDWFGEHVKRKTNKYEKQQWREEYNLRNSTLQAHDQQPVNSTGSQNGDEAVARSSKVQLLSAQRILDNPKQQYRIIQEALDASSSRGNGSPVTDADTSNPAVEADPTITVELTEQIQAEDNAAGGVTQEPSATGSHLEDLPIPDVKEVEDMDAEGEVDDAMY